MSLSYFRLTVSSILFPQKIWKQIGEMLVEVVSPKFLIPFKADCLHPRTFCFFLAAAMLSSPQSSTSNDMVSNFNAGYTKACVLN